MCEEWPPVVFCVHRVHCTLEHACLLDSSMTGSTGDTLRAVLDTASFFHTERYCIQYYSEAASTQVLYVCTGHNFLHPAASRPIPSHTTPRSSWRSSSAVSTAIGHSPGESDRKRGERETWARDQLPLPSSLLARSIPIDPTTDAQTLLLQGTTEVCRNGGPRPRTFSETTSGRIFPIFSFLLFNP